MSKKIVFEPATEIKVTGIIGFLKRKVTLYRTGAKVTCPKEYLGKNSLTRHSQLTCRREFAVYTK